MQTVLDTNVLIRFFTNDIPAKADKVEELLEKEKKIVIPDVVFPELEYILMKKYGLPRSKVIDAYLFLLSQENVKKSTYIKKAIEIYQKTKLDMADCIIAAESLKGLLASFDKNLLRVEKVKAFWK
ncbi:MAG: type II toxin-antitoxin system VapC family toxin [Candidatus Levybacteria bacterium]|nr:type II toxin-antitoxin system VapC family toxin [Candidatus Levybacteria bacterium]